nr:conserved uncharacterized protein [uncultured bacterium]
MRARSIRFFLAAFLFMTAMGMVQAEIPDGGRPSCVLPGRWLAPATGRELSNSEAIASMAGRPVVLLGESHANPADHRWQLHVLAALHAHNPDMAIGFEAFPRDVQPVLDRWVGGHMDEEGFLDETGWKKVWGYDAGLYMPLFHFARMHRVPMVALNVRRELVIQARRLGWANVPANERQGLGNPKPATQAYRERLRRIYESHRPKEGGDEGDFERFVEAQLTWDRAMAEKLAETRRGGGFPLVVGIVGRGHLEYREGIPRQLDDLGISESGVYLTFGEKDPCGEIDDRGMAIADVLFGLDAEKPGDAVLQGPRLGVSLDDKQGEVRILAVIGGSIAEATGILKGDVLLEAAGQRIAGNEDIVAIVGRQAPGTWLPLKVRRDGAERDLVAKFPPRP